MENNLPFALDTSNPISEETKALLEETFQFVLKNRHEYITPEHLLWILLNKKNFIDALQTVDGDVDKIKDSLKDYFNDLEEMPKDLVCKPYPSIQFLLLIEDTDRKVFSCGKEEIENSHLISALINLENSIAGYILKEQINGSEGYFLTAFLGDVEFDVLMPEDLLEGDEEFPLEDDIFISEPTPKKAKDWKKLVVCVNEIYQNFNPLIGRKDEMLKTIRVLCRKDKNNPLHIGEPGVGKTAMVYGLAREIEEGKVPPRLKDTKIYRLDLGSLIAGTQYRGDFEKKIKLIMDGAEQEKNAIIYIDEIHNLVGAGATGEGSLDASNILKPYLEKGDIRFIGSTTYDEYKRYFSKSKGIVRRFTNIDINEPSETEAINILNHLKKHYEDFHQVSYTDEAIKFAVSGSAKYINDRFLPDKAIDLIDESGAEKQIAEGDVKEKTVDKELIAKVLAKMCKVESIAFTEEESQDLYQLETKISSRLFGQDVAVKEVSEAILMSKAGLEEEDKPLASFLFVGPTGVGKTELAKLLAKEMGVELIRFDMSEYAEKHTVAKLIGSPAGYVGYEDGGLLTDAIRKTPNAVLLLDEIEKAHSDIYNILLQVMDYAKLSDNKGNKADFRNVVLIMTSNAGAQYASRANVGFNSTVMKGEAMMKQVKRTFKPEFLNRLSATVVFNDMSREMAQQILEKKINELKLKLNKKQVSIEVTQEAKDYLLEKGFSPEYGARELDRVIQSELKKILMNEILFGKLKEGGEANIILQDNRLKIS